MFHFDFEHVMTEFLIEHTKTFTKYKVFYDLLLAHFVSEVILLNRH